jgi:hypothetical protein
MNNIGIIQLACSMLVETKRSPVQRGGHLPLVPFRITEIVE